MTGEECCSEWRVARQHSIDCPLMARDRIERAEQWRQRALAAEAEVKRMRPVVTDAVHWRHGHATDACLRDTVDEYEAQEGACVTSG